MAILQTNNAGKTSELGLFVQKIALEYHTKELAGVEFPKNLLKRFDCSILTKSRKINKHSPFLLEYWGAHGLMTALIQMQLNCNDKFFLKH